MDQSAGPESRAERASRWPKTVLRLLALAVTVAGAGVWGFASWRRGRAVRPALATPYRNARPGVGYVGDDVCARCHAGIAATYRLHSMGRSLTALEDAPAELRAGAGSHALFESRGFAYSAEGRGGKTFHRETKRGGDGTVVGEVEGEVRYVLGSGARALAFLIRRDDYLFQSPVTWYSQKKQWGLAPSFEAREARFDRQVTPGCLVCHSNRFDHVQGTEGRYREPIFRGLAIGCERCHGPGGLHAEGPTVAAGDGDGPNIVNPGDLSPALREAVCQQCHLLGVTTIARYGRELSDFRPGLPLQKFVTVFVRPGEGADAHPNADHVEQMHRSRCFRASAGALGCISCHDPHEMPAPERKAAYYRGRCLECHATNGCAEPEARRRAVDREDSCVACHMPRSATSDVPHVSTTLHSIPRDGVRGRETVAGAGAAGAEPGLVPFHRDIMDADDLAEAGRDLGVALRQRGAEGAAGAIPLLRKWLDREPDDLLARESEGIAHWAMGQDDEALAAFEAVLARDAGRIPALEGAALAASRLARYEASIGYWRRAVAADPWRPTFRAELAFDLTRVRDWPGAAEAARGALALNPADRTARTALVLATLRTGSPGAAREEFETLLRFDPPDREELVRWFGGLR